MPTYTDNAGNEWNLVIDVDTIRRVRRDTQFAFGTCLNDDMQPWYGMLSDLELMPSVLFSILKPAIVEKGVTEETFLKNVTGEAIDSARMAIWDAFAFFCPKREREMLMRLKEAETAMMDAQQEKADEMVQTFIEKLSSSEPSSESSLDLTATQN